MPFVYTTDLTSVSHRDQIRGSETFGGNKVKQVKIDVDTPTIIQMHMMEEKMSKAQLQP